jgi:hypothetical protein
MNNIIIGIIIFEFILLVFIFFILPSTKETSKIIINTSKKSAKVNCSKTKQSCQQDQDCLNTCSDSEQLTCVSTDNYGKVCLPKVPDGTCNKEKGGISIWTGYGMTESQRWSCICEYPEYYNGEHCDIPNPYYCTDGTIDPSKPLQDESCSCPEKTRKMFRASTNVPFCASTDKDKGGGEYGLLGNIKESPNWENISIIPKDSDSWAQKIYDELYDKDKYKDQKEEIIKNINSVINDKTILTKDLAEQLCKLEPKPDHLCNISFPKIDEMIYTYYKNSYF